MPFPEDRGWKDTVWVDGQVELLVYYGQPSWPHFPFLFHSQTLEMMDRGPWGRCWSTPRHNPDIPGSPGMVYARQKKRENRISTG
jgi:hypothetical protein